MQNKGWVKLWREQFTHAVSERKPWCDGYAWSYLYSQANYKPGIANFRNQYIPVERGQFITSLLKLSKTFGWTWRRTRSFLNGLKNDEMLILKISPKSHNEQHNRQHNRFLTITICNYEKYQGVDEGDDTTDSTTDRRTAAQQKHTIKEFNKKERIYVEGDAPLRLASLLLSEIQKNKKSGNLSPFKTPDLPKWAGEVDLMLRRDGRTSEQIEKVILWCQADPFWWKNVLSASKLRKQFDRLESDMVKKVGVSKGPSW